MNVNGERVLIFGDSTSHVGADNGPNVVDVTQGSNRVSGQPGDLLASLLLEQGAQAARVNARIGRSAFNFFGREDAQGLISSDASFAPTKVIVVLGTNDIGLDLTKDGQAMQAIKDAYEGMGAEVWAIGPYTYNDASLNAGAAPVAEMMQSVFGRRFIDGRPLSVQEGRAGDGVHFGAQSAAQTAQNMMAAIASASSFPWKWVALGIGAALVGAFAFSRLKRTPSLQGLGEYCDPKLAPSAFNRCVARQKRSALGDADWSDVSTALRNKQFKKASKAWKAVHKKHGFVEAPKSVRRELDRLEPHERLAYDAMVTGLGKLGSLEPTKALLKDIMLTDDEPNTMTVAADMLLERGERLSQVTKTGGEIGPHTKAYYHLPIGAGRRIDWTIEQTSPHGKCEAAFTASSGNNFGSARVVEGYHGSSEYCERVAAQDAWVLAKTLRQIEPKGSGRRWAMIQSTDMLERMEKSMNTVAAEQDPEELFGLDANESDEDFGAGMHVLQMLREEDDDMTAVEDYALEKGVKFGSKSPGGYDNGVFYETPTRGMLRISKLNKNPMIPSTTLTWRIHRVHKSAGEWDNAGMDSFNIEYALHYYTKASEEMQIARLEAGFARRYESFEDARREAAAEAWAMTKAIKQEIKKPLVTPEAMQKVMVDAMYNVGRDDLKKRPDLYGRR